MKTLLPKRRPFSEGERSSLLQTKEAPLSFQSLSFAPKEALSWTPFPFALTALAEDERIAFVQALWGIRSKVNADGILDRSVHNMRKKRNPPPDENKE
jgi:uncharacterized tellurite resistance protein B-like protein